MVLEYVPGGTLEDRLRDGEAAARRRGVRDRGGHRRRARARARARRRAPRPEAGERALRRGGPREARRLRHRAHGGGRRDADRSRHGARHRRVHLAGAGVGRSPRAQRPTSTRSASSSTACSPGGCRSSRATRWSSCCMHRDAAAAADRVSSAHDAPAALESTAIAALAKDPARRPRDGAALLAELGVADRRRPDDRDDGRSRDDATQVLARRRRGAPPRGERVPGAAAARGGAACRRRRAAPARRSPAARSPTR